MRPAERKLAGMKGSPWWLKEPLVRSTRRFLGVGGLTVVVLVVLVVVAYLWLDRPVAKYIEDATWRSHPIFLGVTQLGEATWWLVGSVIVCALARLYGRRGLAAQSLLLFCSVATAGILVNLLKVIFGRARPKFLFDPEPEFGFTFFAVGYDFNAFPSGHSSTVAALGAVACLLCPRLAPLWVGGAVIVAASRVIVGAHFATDVIVGSYVGVVSAVATRRWLSVYLSRQEIAVMGGENGA